MRRLKVIMHKSLTILLCFLMVIMNFSPLFIDEVEASDSNTNGVYGVVNFRTKGCGTNTNYYNIANAKNGYTNGCYGADAAFLGYNSDRSKVKFKLSGVTGWVNASDVEVIDYLNNFDNYYTSNYTVENGILVHNVMSDIKSYSGGSSIELGPKPSYLQEGKSYWSYDGHYFYDANINGGKDGYKIMINDYINNSNANAINKNNPYYNYYQYITHRSQSNYTDTDIANYLRNTLGINGLMTSYPAEKGKSLLYGEQISFVQYQNEFGANLGLVLGLAQNESANGTSNIAFYGKNLFGHSAFDSSPGASANSYLSVAQSIYAHDRFFVSEGYLDPCDGRNAGGSYNDALCHLGRYNGGHVGNKASGMNVSYASDPYWGEKAAQFYYTIDDAGGMQDFNKYTLAIKTDASNIGIYKEPNTSSTLLYKTGHTEAYPVIVLKEVTGSMVNGSNKWYKIQTDPVLNSSRTAIVQDYGNYDFNNNYGYVPASYFIKINQGRDIKNRYIITFDPNGGKFTDGETTPKKLTVEQNVIPKVNNPIKDNDIFVGWTPTVMGASGNVTYKAMWKNTQYNITFNPNGGRFSDGITTNKTVKYDAGTMPSTGIMTRDGYTFKGWTPDFEIVTGDKTYTAVWEKNEVYYDITFNADGGKFNDGKETKVVKTAEGKKPTVEMPIKEGYIFKGWDPEITTASRNTTYKAIWDKGTLEDILVKKQGKFYLESLTIKNDKLQIKGYNTINGINNNLDTDIIYELILQNQTTGQEYTQEIPRLTNTSEMSIPILSTDGKDYKYSWFKGNISFKNIPDGDYTAFIRSYNDKYYSKSYVQNILLNDQETNYNGDSKFVTITNNYMDENIPVEFNIRSKKLGIKETSYDVNQYSLIQNISFVGDKLHIIAATYSVGLDMRKATPLSRELIFENIDTFNQKRIEVGSLSTPVFPIKLISADEFGQKKDRAWFDKIIDISDLDKGTYAIYVTNNSNISDYGELYDVLFADLSNASKTINGKKYSFVLNEAKRNRIELIVE